MTISLRTRNEGEVLFRHHFENLPVAFFGSVMGLTGLSLAWRPVRTKSASKIA